MIRLALDDPNWFELVEGHPDATVFHHPAWASLLSDCYGYPGFVLAQLDAAGRVAAGLPVIDATSWIGGRRWISLPFTDFCAPLLAPGASPGELAAALARIPEREGIARLEVRAPLPGSEASARTNAVMHTFSLSPDLDAIARGIRHSQVRRDIARAEREGVEVRRAEAESDLVETFYTLHLQKRRQQGVPVQPRRFLRLLWQRVLERELGFCLLAYSNGTPIAGAVFLTWNETVTYKYSASDCQFLRQRPNHLLLWRAICWSGERGFRRLDFGRSDLENQGLREFKSSWGAVEEPLVYSAFGDRASVDGKRLRGALAQVIRHSPPSVCRLLGEALYRYAA